MKAGEIYWIIRATIEEQNYGGDFVWPRKMVLSDKLTPNGHYRLACNYNPETGFLDHDANASCFVSKTECYGLEKDALFAYSRALMVRANGLIETNQKVIARLTFLIDEDNQPTGPTNGDQETG